MVWFKKLFSGLKKTSGTINEGIKKVAKSKKLDEASITDFEDLLITTDLSTEAVMQITKKLRNAKFANALDEGIVKTFLKDELISLVKDSEEILALPSPSYGDKEKYSGTHVIMVCGVNGSGKTTTIGKLAAKLKEDGYSVMIAACDTFRAAANEQLAKWAERADCEIVCGGAKADPSSVAYKAFDAAIKSKTDVLLIDTAGRLHNNQNLMAELEKIVRTLQKLNMAAPHEVILVLDGTTGQNAYSQVKLFNESVKITGLVITKLDGTSKGGVLVGIANKYKLPIYYIGVGEDIADLDVFKSEEFVKALLDIEE